MRIVTSVGRLAVVTAAALAPLLAACGGSGGGGGSEQMVLVSFNHPNVSGVPLNEPLIFMFSDDVEEGSVTPDTIQVVGSPNFTFERIVVDGPLVALLPSVPNFEDYSDSGLQKGTTYTVFLPTFPAADTVRSTSGKPLLMADSFTFTTLPTDSFIEARRELVHGPGATDDPPGDEDGCVNNLGNEHFGDPPVMQFGTDEDASLLCLINEGAPRVLLEASVPSHDDRDFGNPSAASPGRVELGAIRVRMNEPVDPVSVVPYVPTEQKSLNVQLWRVGDNDGTPVTPSQVPTNKPVVVQDTDSTEIFLVALGPQPQGTYMVNIQGVRDLAGNLVRVDDRPVKPASCLAPANDYEEIDCSLVGRVPPGYRIYFRTVQVPSTSGALSESFANTFNEGRYKVFTRTNTGTNDPDEPILGSPQDGSDAGLTLTNAQPGQATTANWNDAYRWLGLASARVNTRQDNGLGRLKAVHQPYLGSGGDSSLTVTGNATLSSTGGDANNDGIFEFESLTVSSGGTLTLSGPKPLQILCRGTVTINGTIQASGQPGRFGIDSDGSAAYTNTGAIERGGLGGAGGAGGGTGGRGGPKATGVGPQNGTAGTDGKNLFSESQTGGAGGFGPFGDGDNGGGGGGGYGSAGTPGEDLGGGAGTGGSTTGSPDFARALSSFVPDRCYQPNANVAGGAGGGGGGAEDDSAADNETGDTTITSSDDGAGGGGGGGGAVWILADTITVGSSGRVFANGGRGGNTYAAADQVIDVGDPGDPSDDVVTGVTDATAPGTGEGAGGGGGSGGAILFQARYDLTVDASAVFEALGGAGGTSGFGGDGGAGGEGRIGLMAFPGANYSVSGTVDPAAGITGNTWNPTIDTVSQGVSVWHDLGTSTANFVTPFWTDNFDDLDAAGLERGVDYDAFLEFQAASTLIPNSSTPTDATGLVQWTPVVFDGPDPIDNHRFVRWRWRFNVAGRDVGGTQTNPDFDPASHAMPTIFDFTLPFQN